MNQKKKKIIIISSSIAVVCVILIMLLILVFTGAFKSNKEKFFQYAGKLMNFEDGFVESSISNYFKKLQQRPYNTNGTFNVNVEGIPGEDTDSLNGCNISFSGMVDTPNNKAEQSISLNYSEDVSFPFMYRQIENVIALQTNSVSKKFVGIDTENLDEFTDKLQESDISTPTSYEFSLNNLDTSSFDLSEEELLRLQHTYIEPIVNMFENDRFESVKENNLEGYKIRLSGEDFKNITTTFLQSLKDDQQTLDKLNATIFSANKLTQSSIEQLIKQTQNETADESFYVEIVVYGSKGKLNKFQIQNNSFKLELQKNLNGNGVQYNITFTGLDNGSEVAKFYANASYTGIQLAENVTGNYELGIEYNYTDNSNMILTKSKTASEQNKINNESDIIALAVQEIMAEKMAAKYTDNATTEDSSNETYTKEDYEGKLQEENVNIEENSDGNISITFIDTDHKFEVDSSGKIVTKPEPKESEQEESEQEDSGENKKVKFAYNFVNEVEFTDSVEIEDLTEGENCLILNNYSASSITKFLQSAVERIVNVNEEMMTEVGLSTNPFLLLPSALINYSALNTLNSVQNTPEDNISGSSNSMSELEISTFNNRFEMYEGTNLGGATVKGLLSTIQANNVSGSSHQIEEINFKGEEFEANEQNIATIKDEIQTSTVFKVEFEKNEQGIIYRVVINERGEGADTTSTNTNETSNENTTNTTGNTTN